MLLQLLIDIAVAITEQGVKFESGLYPVGKDTPEKIDGILPVIKDFFGKSVMRIMYAHIYFNTYIIRLVLLFYIAYTFRMQYDNCIKQKQRPHPDGSSCRLECVHTYMLRHRIQ